MTNKNDEKSHNSTEKIAEVQEKFRHMIMNDNFKEKSSSNEVGIVDSEKSNPVYRDNSQYSLTPDSVSSSLPNSRNRSIKIVNECNSLDKIIKNPVDNTTIDSEDGHIVHNNWTTANRNTVNKWKKEITRSSFIYEAIKDRNNAILQKILIWMLIFNTLTTVVTAVQGAILGVDPDNPDAVWVGFGLSIVLFIIGGVTTILSGAVSIYKWDNIVNELATHISKLDGFYAIISHEMNLSDRLKKDANEFITKNAEAYLHITQNCPDISNHDYIKGVKKYKDTTQVEDITLCTTTNYKSSQKYLF